MAAAYHGRSMARSPTRRTVRGVGADESMNLGDRWLSSGEAVGYTVALVLVAGGTAGF
jgi:hypothetical protein